MHLCAGILPDTRTRPRLQIFPRLQTFPLTPCTFMFMYLLFASDDHSSKVKLNFFHWPCNLLQFVFLSCNISFTTTWRTVLLYWITWERIVFRDFGKLLKPLAINPLRISTDVQNIEKGMPSREVMRLKLPQVNFQLDLWNSVLFSFSCVVVLVQQTVLCHCVQC